MLRHAQIHIVVSQMPQKSDSDIFYKRKRYTTVFLRATIFSAKGGSLTNSNISLTRVPALLAYQVCTL
eukprot:UN21388